MFEYIRFFILKFSREYFNRDYKKNWHIIQKIILQKMPDVF